MWPLEGASTKANTRWMALACQMAVLATLAVLTLGVITDDSSPGLSAARLVARPVAAPFLHSRVSALRLWTGKPDPAAPVRPGKGLGNKPLMFEANHGQSDSKVKFLARGGDYTVFLTPVEVAVVWGHGGEEAVVLRLNFPGANPEPILRGLDALPGKVNYLVGNQRSQWRTGLRGYARVEYEEVYPGINLIFYGNQEGQLQHDWVVGPGASPEAIRLCYEGVDTLRIDGRGDLVLRREQLEFRQHKPALYQEIAGRREPVEGGFVWKKRNEVGFQVAPYDVSRPLVIDPVLSYATRLGGSGVLVPAASRRGDAIQDIAVDAAGNIYVTGYANSLDFPTSQPLQATNRGGSDVFVTKLNAAGSVLVYSTYLGSSGFDNGYGIAVDTAGNAYVIGDTTGLDFPMLNPAQPAHAGGFRGLDGFVAKLNPTGSALIYSTYLGGNDLDSARAIAVDGAGNAYVAGWTSSSNFPTRNSLQATARGSGDFFVTKLGPSGSALLYSTYIGGSGREVFDDVSGPRIVVDAAGSAFISGTTDSGDFPTTPGAFQPAFAGRGTGNFGDAFVLKLNPAGSALQYSTYLGGKNDDEGWGLAVDAAGSAYLTGRTASEDFPTARALQPVRKGVDAFVTKLNATGSALVYSTFLGGSSADAGVSISLDPTGNAYVTGATMSDDFPLLRPFQAAKDSGFCSSVFPCTDAFVSELNAEGSALVYSTYLGGTGLDGLNRIVVDTRGNAYVTGVVDVALVNPFSTRGDGFIARIDPTGDIPAPTAVTAAASFRRSTVVPGGLASIFGYRMTNISGIVTAETFPLPTAIRGTSVTVDGFPAPLLAVANVDGQEQINLQVPYEARASSFMVINNGVSSRPILARGQPEWPDIFTVGGDYGAIQHASDFALVTPSSPAERGEVVIVYATGLGAVDPPIRSGAPAPLAPLSRTLRIPLVFIADIRAEVLFSGLTPGYVGLYQVNVRVPEGVPSGDADLGMRGDPNISFSRSNVVKLPVR